MIGTYYRLSLADEDVGADKAESNSIQGQRGLVEGYIMARPELATEPRQEYVDDGYSGTSTSRPAFQRLIQDAQDGKVKTIIVKDFSRFVRDYIEAGDYMERIFHCWAFDSSLSTMGMTVECRPGTMYADWK